MDWGKVNQPTSPEVFDELYEKAIKYFNTKVILIYVSVCVLVPRRNMVLVS